MDMFQSSKTIKKVKKTRKGNEFTETIEVYYRAKI